MVHCELCDFPSSRVCDASGHEGLTSESDWELVSQIRDRAPDGSLLLFRYWRPDAFWVYSGRAVSFICPFSSATGSDQCHPRYHNMNNRLGLAAWRWLFIFDFIISIPIAVLGFFVCPGKSHHSLGAGAAPNI